MKQRKPSWQRQLLSCTFIYWMHLCVDMLCPFTEVTDGRPQSIPSPSSISQPLWICAGSLAGLTWLSRTRSWPAVWKFRPQLPAVVFHLAGTLWHISRSFQASEHRLCLLSSHGIFHSSQLLLLPGNGDSCESLTPCCCSFYSSGDGYTLQSCACACSLWVPGANALSLSS